MPATFAALVVLIIYHITAHLSIGFAKVLKVFFESISPYDTATVANANTVLLLLLPRPDTILMPCTATATVTALSRYDTILL